MSIQTEIYDKAQLYAEYYPKVLQYIGKYSNRNMDAEEIARTVFMKVIGEWDTFDPKKSSVSTWIFNITRSTLIDHQRAIVFRQHGALSEILTDGSDDIQDCPIMEDEGERLADALESLSTEERDLIVLHYYSGQNLLHIAEPMGRPYGQVKQIHVKALEKLRRQIGKGNGESRAKNSSVIFY